MLVFLKYKLLQKILQFFKLRFYCLRIKLGHSSSVTSDKGYASLCTAMGQQSSDTILIYFNACIISIYALTLKGLDVLDKIDMYYNV